MTTELKQDTRTGGSALLGAATACAVMLAALAVAGALLADQAAALGALAGGGLALLVFAFGTSVVHVVSGLMPSMSLMLALLTYALQLMVMAMVLVALETSGVAGDALSRGWFTTGVILITLMWMAAQVWLFTKLRIPLYDLSRSYAPGGER